MPMSEANSYLLRRLHSLTGVVPDGVFLLGHLFANSYAVHGPLAYDRVSARLAGLPYVVLIEGLGIALPILVHMVLGTLILVEAQPNLRRYPTPANARYVLQRLTGIVLAAYVVVHVWVTRLSPAVLSGDTDLFALMARQLAHPWVFGFYVLGVVAAAWHFGNGLFGFSIHWGLATGRGAQRAMGRLGLAVFVVLALVGVNSLLAFRHRPVGIFERVGISGAGAAPPAAPAPGAEPRR